MICLICLNGVFLSTEIVEFKSPNLKKLKLASGGGIGKATEIASIH